MNVLLALAGTFAIAALACIYLAPRLADAARRYGLVDAPDGSLKTQKTAVAYLGGLAVYMAVLTALAVTLPIGGEAPNDLFDDPQVLGMLLGGTLFMAVGLLDDLTGLTPRDKLLGQLLACAVLIKAGVAVHLVSLPVAAQIGLTVLWVLACCNAINLIDVHDGLAVSVGGASALGFVALGVMVGDLRLAVLAAALAGASFGFLAINRPPARQYLGDTGSLFIGSTLAMLALMARYESDSQWMPYLVPLALLALPFIEVTQLVLTRLHLGLSPFRGSRHHIAHRLLDRGFSQKGVVLFNGALQLVFVTVALIGLALSQFEVAAGATLCTLAGLCLVGVLFLSPSQPHQHENQHKPDTESLH
jgi:UDP-GlcNAc:undecaprenyl-phosphate GlcNAc-1-phosphate transferase